MTKAELYRQVDDLRQRLGGRMPKTYAGLLSLVDYAIPHLRVVGHPMDSRKVAGLLLRGEESVILLNTSFTPVSLRFTLAHELIHFFLHPGERQLVCARQNSPLEWQANEGAAELLVPRHSFLPTMENICSNFWQEKDRIAAAAIRFGVSEQVIRYRIKSLRQYYSASTRYAAISAAREQAQFAGLVEGRQRASMPVAGRQSL